MTSYSFIRFDHETGNLEHIGSYADRQTAEQRGRQEMISSGRIGGAIVEDVELEDDNGLRRSAQRVVAVAPAGPFIDFDDTFYDMLTWWRCLTPETKAEFATRALDLEGPARADVGIDALHWIRYGDVPYEAELREAHAEFADAIVGHDAPWLEGAHPSVLE